MNLLQTLLQLTQRWGFVFPQTRTLNRAISLAFGTLCGVGRRTITRAIGFHGNAQKDWSADYKVFSRSPWEPRALFNPILQHAIEEHQLKRVVVAIDDTRVWRNGKHVPETQWHRDPMGPPFQTNLRWGHRFLQASLLLPLYQKDQVSSPRGIPVRFEMAPVVRKPGKKADEATLQEYQRQKKQKNLSTQSVAMIRELRQRLNLSGQTDKPLWIVGDGSFSNRTLYTEGWEKEGVSLITRVRKDVRLCKPASGKGRRIYGKTKFTPEMVRRRDSIAQWQTVTLFHGGASRQGRVKELTRVLWQGGSKSTVVRLLVVAPVGYRISKNGRKYYRQPAFLLTTNLTAPAEEILQAYFDRWEIEVNHRDEKHILGVGDAQVWNEKSVSKVPALIVAMYSWLLLAGLKCHGSTRTEAFEALPKWRRGARRASCQDLVTLLRRQMAEKPARFETAEQPASYATMVTSAAA